MALGFCLAWFGVLKSGLVNTSLVKASEGVGEVALASLSLSQRS